MSFKKANQQFLTFKHNAEQCSFNFKSDNSKTYHGLKPLKNCKITDSLGGIHYEFLKHLSRKSLDFLFTTFSDIWFNVRLPVIESIDNYFYTQTQKKQLESRKLLPNSSDKVPLQNHGVYDQQKVSFFSLNPTTSLPFTNAASEVKYLQWIILSGWKPL